MSYNTMGPVATVKSPSLERAFGHMNLSEHRQQLPVVVPMSQRAVSVVAQEQLRLPIELYRAADSAREKCFSTIDSPDPRLRAISQLCTEYATEVIEEKLRKPLLQETQVVLKTKPKTDKLLFRFDHDTIPVIDQKRFVHLNDGKPGDLLIYAQTTTLQAIATSCYPLLKGAVSLRDRVEMLDAPGESLTDDFGKRVRNLLKTRYLPDCKCFEWLIENKKTPLEEPVIREKKKPFSLGILAVGIVNEAFRRMRDSEKFNPNWTEALIPLYMKENPDSSLAEGRSLGQTLDYPVKMSTW